MIQETAVKGLCIVCDRQGYILRVLRDDIEMLSGFRLPASFFSIFDVDCRQKSEEFWNILRRESSVLDWELNANKTPFPEACKFSGFVTGEEIWITASKQNEALENMFDEMIRINNEQQNLLRSSAKSLSSLKKATGKETDVDVLNYMTLLNNELVNTQRTLMKQNVEITRLNDQLQQINAELEQFTYVASHDMKEPLRMVTSFMRLLKSKYGRQLDEKANSYIGYALDGGNRMQKMINGILELSKTGRKNIVKEIADIDKILQEVEENIIRLIEETQTEIVVKTALPVLPVCREDISRLFQNLLSNAIKFRKKGINPVIQVSATEEELVWVFCIEDNGIGINEEKFEKIFELFARLHSPETYEGSGIGLAVCKKIVEQHGGRIWVESDEGRGSVFYFTIPKKI